MEASVNFSYETNFRLQRAQTEYSDWIDRVVRSEGFELGEVTYVFCDDEYLLGINQEYLNHDTFTDIITFDYTQGIHVSADIFISVERVEENAKTFKVSFNQELLRVMVHGTLHLMKYNDKVEEDVVEMRSKEEEKIKMFHVER